MYYLLLVLSCSCLCRIFIVIIIIFVMSLVVIIVNSNSSNDNTNSTSMFTNPGEDWARRLCPGRIRGLRIGRDLPRVFCLRRVEHRKGAPCLFVALGTPWTQEWIYVSWGLRESVHPGVLGAHLRGAPSSAWRGQRLWSWTEARERVLNPWSRCVKTSVCLYCMFANGWGLLLLVPNPFLRDWNSLMKNNNSIIDSIDYNYTMLYSI